MSQGGTENGHAAKLTPTQRRMLALLSDGLPHTRRELHGCLHDDLGPLSNVQPHVTALRKILAPTGRLVICELSGGRICYRIIPAPQALS